VGLLREAVAIDSTFASAWRLLASALGNAGMSNAARDSATERAYAFRERLPERERMNVEGTYFFVGPHRDRQKAIAVYERAVALGDSFSAANNLGEVLRSRREFARAESLYVLGQQAGQGVRFSGIAYTNRFEMQLARGDMAGAARTLAELRQKAGMNRAVRLHAFILHYGRGELDAAAADVDSMRTAGERALLPLADGLAAALALIHGRVDAARRDYSGNLAGRQEYFGARSALGDSLVMAYGTRGTWAEQSISGGRSSHVSIACSPRCRSGTSTCWIVRTSRRPGCTRSRGVQTRRGWFSRNTAPT